MKNKNDIIIGVLDLQGAVREHIHILNEIGIKAVKIKAPSQLSLIDGLIIPGGESTTIGKLLVKYSFIEPIKKFSEQKKPIYGTCAGLIIIAKKITEGDQPLLNLMNIEARRNAFGRQRESFEANLSIQNITPPLFRGVFIRAPWIESANKNVKILSYFQDVAVMAREGHLLVSAFHPELTHDGRIHQYFIKMVNGG